MPNTEVLQALPVTKSAAAKITEFVCGYLNLPVADVRFLHHYRRWQGSYGENEIHLYRSGRHAENLAHELAHHVSDLQGVPAVHGAEFWKNYDKICKLINNYFQVHALELMGVV